MRSYRNGGGGGCGGRVRLSATVRDRGDYATTIMTAALFTYSYCCRIGGSARARPPRGNRNVFEYAQPARAAENPNNVYAVWLALAWPVSVVMTITAETSMFTYVNKSIGRIVSRTGRGRNMFRSVARRPLRTRLVKADARIAYTKYTCRLVTTRGEPLIRYSIIYPVRVFSTVTDWKCGVESCTIKRQLFSSINVIYYLVLRS